MHLKYAYLADCSPHGIRIDATAKTAPRCERHHCNAMRTWLSEGVSDAEMTPRPFSLQTMTYLIVRPIVVAFAIVAAIAINALLLLLNMAP
jgi:hypothetical protein